MKNNLVFVYGSLRKHQHNSHLLNEAKCLAEQCWTNGLLFNSGLGYPYLVQEDGIIYGELYEVNDTQLKKLDQLEGYSGENQVNYYHRIEQTITTDTQTYTAFVYVLSDESRINRKKQIISGDWSIELLVKQNEIQYFAYGSCMDHERFIQSGVDHWFRQMKGRGVLERYSLRFTRKASDGGRADIVEEGGKVEGIIYQIPKECLRYLYKREGVNIGIYRPTVVDVVVDNQLMKNVLTFVVINKEEETLPPKKYLTEIFRGAKGILSEEYLKFLKTELQNRFHYTYEEER